jgi:hypothetical protein
VEELLYFFSTFIIFFTGQQQQTGSCDYDEAPQGDEDGAMVNG